MLGTQSLIGKNRPATLPKASQLSRVHSLGRSLLEKDSESMLRGIPLPSLPETTVGAEALWKLVNGFEDETGLWPRVVDTATLGGKRVGA